jgi:hypothetical protein
VLRQLGCLFLQAMTIQYRPEELRITFLVKWRGTIFPLVVADPMFWGLLLVHVCLLLWHGHQLALGNDGLPPLDWGVSQVSLGLLTFFVVFYGNQCYLRYFQLHDHCMAMERALWLWARLIKLHFAAKTTAVKWNMM